VQGAAAVAAAALLVPVVVTVRGGRQLRRAAAIAEQDKPTTPMHVLPHPGFAVEDRRLRMLAAVPPEVLDRLIADYEQHTGDGLGLSGAVQHTWEAA
jgi:hypothetical protein